METKVVLDSKTFKEFTVFDCLKRRKAWKSPVTFALIMSISALVCFIMHKVDGAVLLGTVLLVLGLGMFCYNLRFSLLSVYSLHDFTVITQYSFFQTRLIVYRFSFCCQPPFLPECPKQKPDAICQTPYKADCRHTDRKHQHIIV